MKKLIVCLLLGLSTASVAGEVAELYKKSGDHSFTLVDALPSTSNGVTEVGMERTSCFGTCPVYSVIIERDGTFRYDGGRYAPKAGQWTGHVRKWDLDNLTAFICDTDYMKLASHYEIGYTDSPTAYTTVITDGKRKIISNYADAGPIKLWAIQQLIDKLLLEATWDPVKKP